MRALIVIPCYNECERLLPVHVRELLSDPKVDILFVNDGSRDRTFLLLKKLSALHPGRIQVLDFEFNAGKAEAVRKGLLHALEAGAELTGYTDADFATPPTELLRLIDEIEHSGAEIVLGSRVALLGTTIKRSAIRHIVGRLFASVASFAVGSPIYDTQCGAKFFRTTSALRAALAKPFSSRWAFDVELLCRLFGRLESSVSTSFTHAREVPLRQWCDVPGSKLSFVSMAKSFTDVVLIWLRVERYARTR